MHAEFSNEIFLNERFLPEGEGFEVEFRTVERINSSGGSIVRRELSSSMSFSFELLFLVFFGDFSTAVTEPFSEVFFGFFLGDGMFARPLFDCRKKEKNITENQIKDTIYITSKTNIDFF